MKTCLHALTPAAKKHCDNLSYFFSTLFYESYLLQILQSWKKILLTINFTHPVERVLYEFQSSESKTYSSQMRGQVKVFCPAGVQKIYNDDKALPRSGKCFWLVLLQETFALTHGYHRCLPPFPINMTLLNPLSPNSDQHQFSPNNIHTMSRDEVMRLNKMIT